MSSPPGMRSSSSFSLVQPPAGRSEFNGKPVQFGQKARTEAAHKRSPFLCAHMIFSAIVSTQSLSPRAFLAAVGICLLLLVLGIYSPVDFRGRFHLG